MPVAQDRAPAEMKQALESAAAGDLPGAKALFEKAVGKGHVPAVGWVDRLNLHAYASPPLGEPGWPKLLPAPTPRGEVAAENDFLKLDREAKEKAEKDPSEGAKLFAELEKKYPASPEAAHNLAVCLARLGRWAEALEAEKRATVDHPARHHTMAGALLEAGKTEEALESAGRAVAGASQAKPAYVRRAAIYEKLGKIDECLADLGLALGIDSEDAALRHKRIALFEKKGDPAGCLQDLDALISSGREPALRRKRARILIQIGNASQAVADYDALLKDNDEDFDLHLERFEARAQAAMYDDARADLTWCIAKKPGAELYARRAQLEIEQHRWQPAEPDLKKALELDPKCFNAWYWKGWMHKEKREFGPAHEAFGKCIELNPKHGNSWYHWAQVLGTMRQYERALEAALKAREFCPQDMQDNIDFLLKAGRSQVAKLHANAADAAWKFIDKSGSAKDYLKESAQVVSEGDAWIVTFKKSGEARPSTGSVKVVKKTLESSWVPEKK